jgi:D-xylose transport system substrate-binding protein
VHLHVARPLRPLARLVAGALTWSVLVASAGALPPHAASASIVRVSGPPGVSAREFGGGFAVMTQFETLARAGRGKVAVLLPGADDPDTDVTADADVSVLERALRSTGLPSARYVVQAAGGSDAIQYADAVRDISNGARVIVLDPINSGVGAQIEAFATSHRIPVIDYDSLTPAGSRSYEVGFDPVEAGKLMGRGLVACATAWHVSRPHVVVLGDDRSDGTDNSESSDSRAALLVEGYDEAVHPLVKTGRWTTVSPPTASGDSGAELRSILSAHRDVNAALFADAATESEVFTILQSRHPRPKSFPVAGLSTTVPVLDDVLTGHLCGTVDQSVVAEAQAAVALALYVRAGATPPHSLVNGTVDDTTARVQVPSVVLPPLWVTAKNMKSTVQRDGTLRISQLCAGKYATACAAAGLSSSR